MSFRNGFRGLVARGQATLRRTAAEMWRQRYGPPLGSAPVAESDSQNPPPFWGSGDEKDIRKPREPLRFYGIRSSELFSLADLAASAEEAAGEPAHIDALALMEIETGGRISRTALLAAMRKALPQEDYDFILRGLEPGTPISRMELLGALGEALVAAEALSAQTAQRVGHAEDDQDVGELWPLSAEEAKLVSGAAASTINHTLARLFLRLGPPPTGASGDFMPVSSGGGGAHQ
ncbi:hypothetical protein ABTY98_41580 [Streptomyces sp. NPDC096040]|uniref:hypothetical protein n=1 Tax=Streptomyces sp. NPDC096040 TaxID=3155541 RepID=UPI0033220780